ncbi:MAG TPA: LysR family transcriptional regulator [Gammaproteobacteria bacterium]|nr:LysR family transcriptional regulator [Gammaproteobacteria bacterium]
MYLELRHLRSFLAIDETGSLARAAERLHLTQSALSHQVKALENYYGTPLFLRSTKPLRLTPAGRKLLELARHVLPGVEQVEGELQRVARGRAGRLHISIECHACFEWLLPLLDRYREQWPEVEVDIRLGVSFDPIPALQNGTLDLVISSDPVAGNDLVFEPLFAYQALLVLARGHKLTKKDRVEAGDLADQTLITYPVERKRLEVFSRFLQPAGVEPAFVRQVELTAIILQLVAGRRGVAVLPDWVVREPVRQQRLAVRALGASGLFGTLYAAVRSLDRSVAYMDAFIRLARDAAGSGNGVVTG